MKWRRRHERRHQSPTAVHLVRFAVPVVEGYQMKNVRLQKIESSAQSKRKFAGAGNPRHLCAIDKAQARRH